MVPVIPRVDDLQWLALTVWLEARGEPWLSKLGVAYTIVNRAKTRARSIPDTVLQGWQFSGWNTTDQNRMTVDDAQSSPIWLECYKAACASLFMLVEDPTNGADHYMNVALVQKMRKGTLPKWWDESKTTAHFGAHTFAKLG